MPYAMQKDRSVSDNERFITLMRVAREDHEIGKEIVSILSLDNFNRKSVLNTWISRMQLEKAPADLVNALAVLLDDAVAEKALSMIGEEQSG